ncbi:metalloregulator ArsR/SmtB family transcription factor [soil metagenome]
MDGPTAVATLNALSHASRLSAFRRLVQAGPDGLPVGELREQLDLPPATLTAHLNVLRSAGLADDTREGRVIRVRAGYARMNALIAYLTENCCAGAADCGPAVVCKPAAKPAAKPTGRPTTKRTRK